MSEFATGRACRLTVGCPLAFVRFHFALNFTATPEAWTDSQQFVPKVSVPLESKEILVGCSIAASFSRFKEYT